MARTSRGARRRSAGRCRSPTGWRWPRRGGASSPTCGDGGFLFTATELATAVAHQLDVTVLVHDDAAFGSIAAYQERRYGKAYACDLVNPDLLLFGRSFGIPTERIDDVAELPAAMARATAGPGPSMVVWARRWGSPSAERGPAGPGKLGQGRARRDVARPGNEGFLLRLREPCRGAGGGGERSVVPPSGAPRGGAGSGQPEEPGSRAALDGGELAGIQQAAPVQPLV